MTEQSLPPHTLLIIDDEAAYMRHGEVNSFDRSDKVPAALKLAGIFLGRRRFTMRVFSAEAALTGTDPDLGSPIEVPNALGEVRVYLASEAQTGIDLLTNPDKAELAMGVRKPDSVMVDLQFRGQRMDGEAVLDSLPTDLGDQQLYGFSLAPTADYRRKIEERGGFVGNLPFDSFRRLADKLQRQPVAITEP